jgi:uncharacterized protein
MQAAPLPLSDPEIEELQRLLDRIAPPLEPLDTSSLDGYLCGVLLQPRPVAAADWLAFVGDVDGRALPSAFPARRLADLAQRRHAELNRAIGGRQWFDPWVYEAEDDVSPHELVLPWVAGFAAAMDHFPALMRIDDPSLLEPLAVIYAAIDPDDLEDAEALLAMIETLEPPADLAQAAEDLVRSVLLIADVSRPLAAQPLTRRPRPPGSRRP